MHTQYSLSLSSPSPLSLSPPPLLSLSPLPQRLFLEPLLRDGWRRWRRWWFRRYRLWSGKRARVAGGGGGESIAALAKVFFFFFFFSLSQEVCTRTSYLPPSKLVRRAIWLYSNQCPSPSPTRKYPPLGSARGDEDGICICKVCRSIHIFRQPSFIPAPPPPKQTPSACSP
ncbi:hypothetical protein EV426DRAFT_262379 [Tirmania nivea]|nr:hypothetical protein EV426DRAFT_262379 [Tirmania nivea]